MGLFGGSSTTAPVTTTNITETTREVNQQLSDSLGISAEGRSTVNVTDAGAIAQNAEVARAVVAGSNNLVNQVSRVVAGTNDSITNALQQSLSFGRSAQDVNRSALSDALSFGRSAQSLIKDSTSGALDKALNFARSTSTDANALIKQNISGALTAVERATQSAIGAAQPSVDVKQIAIVVVLVLGVTIFMVSKK